MNQKQARERGFINGYDIASSNIHMELDAENFMPDDLARFIDLCCETESDSFRQYSPFEFFAKEVNELKYPDEVWDAYDDGVQKGITKRVIEYKKENKSGFAR